MSKRTILTKASASVASMILILLFLCIGNGFLGFSALPMALFALFFIIAVALCSGKSWDEITAAIRKRVGKIAMVFLILSGIGFVMGAWVVSGTIPAIGAVLVQMIRPDSILLFSFLICCVFSVAVGSNFCAMGTIGLILFSIARIQNIPAGIAAAACICGTGVCCCCSPISDVFIQTAEIYQCKPADIIRQCIIPVLITVAVSAAYFWKAGQAFSVPDPQAASEVASELYLSVSRYFKVSGLVLLPLAVIILLTILRLPSEAVLFLSGFSAILIGIFYQGFSVHDCIQSVYSGFRSASMLGAGVPDILSRLTDRGGILSMTDGILFLLLITMCLAVMELIGTFELLSRIIGTCRTKASLILHTLGMTAASALITGDAFSSLMITHDTLLSECTRLGVKDQLLIPVSLSANRIVNNCIPWCFTAQYAASVFRINTWDYVPNAVFFFVFPSVAVVIQLFLCRKRKV